LAKFEELTSVGISPDSISSVDRRGGVYELFHRDALVYVGKSDANLDSRLTGHWRKISGRSGIEASDVGFRALYVEEDLSAVAPETLLIKHYRKSIGSPWNKNGFGNRDPGRQRDKSIVRASHFDSLYPIDLARTCGAIHPGPRPLIELLAELKADLPFLFRYQGQDGGSGSNAFRDTTIDIATDQPSVFEVFEQIARALQNWQLTALKGYAIL